MRTEQEIRDRITQIKIKMTSAKITQSHYFSLSIEKTSLEWVLNKNCTTCGGDI